MAHSKQEQDYAKTVELGRFKNEAAWPGPYIHVKTWPWIEPRRYGILNKGTCMVIGDGSISEIFGSYEELVEQWMGD